MNKDHKDVKCKALGEGRSAKERGGWETKLKDTGWQGGDLLADNQDPLEPEAGLVHGGW